MKPFLLINLKLRIIIHILFLLFTNILLSKPWTIDDMFRVKSISQVQISPDGEKVLVTVISTQKVQNSYLYNYSILLGDVKSKSFSKLVDWDYPNYSPKWSPDGSMIAFISNGNVWTLPSHGGKIIQATNAKTSINDYSWSPDGTKIAYTESDLPTMEVLKYYGNQPYWKVIDSNNMYVRLYVVPVKDTLSKYDAKLLTEDNINVTAFDWSPNSTDIAYSFSKCTTAYMIFTSNIAIVDINTAKSKVLYENNNGNNQPRFSPDGKWIAFVELHDPSYFNGFYAFNLVSPDGQFQHLIESENSVVQIIDWSKDSKGLFFIENVKTETKIKYLNIEDLTNKIYSANSTIIKTASLDHSKNYMALVLAGNNIPEELFLSSSTEYNPSQITNLNQEINDLPEIKTEIVKWRSYDNLEIEGLLTYPTGYQPGKKYPVLTYIHGGPTDLFKQKYIGDMDLYPVPVFADGGYFVFRPNIRGSDGYGFPFRFANNKDFGGGDFQDVMTGIDSLISWGIADSERLGIMGWSYGGYMTNWAVTKTNRFKAASTGAGLFNFISFQTTSDIPELLHNYLGDYYYNNYDLFIERSPMRHIKNVETPLLIQHGELDYRVPVSQAYELYTSLKTQNKTVKMVAYSKTPHTPSDPNIWYDVNKRNYDWFINYILPDTTTMRVENEKNGSDANQINTYLYPIPASDYITIKTDERNEGNYLIKIFNINGQEVLYKEEYISDFSSGKTFNLPSNTFPGSYYVQVTKDGKYIITKKIIIK